MPTKCTRCHQTITDFSKTIYMPDNTYHHAECPKFECSVCGDIIKPENLVQKFDGSYLCLKHAVEFASEQSTPIGDSVRTTTFLEQWRKQYKNGHPDFLPITLEELELHDKKNHDYAKGGSPLGNFERVSAILNLYPNLPFNPITIALIYMLKQLDCVLWGICKNIEQKVEGLDGRFADISVYSKIARCAWRNQNKK